MHVCIIGAGAAGLTTAKHLAEEGITFDILEKRDGLGGLWYFDEAVSSVSDSTTASTSKTYLQFSDFPMAQEIPYFPHHSVYLDYLKQYAQAYGLLEHIHYNSPVIRLQKTASGWNVTMKRGQETETKHYEAVAVCSGLHHIPLMPDIPNSQAFGGEIVHSSLLKSVEELRGKRVVVVGGGESGADLVQEVAPIAAKTYLSLRRGIALTRHWSPENLPADYDSTRAKVWLPRQFLHDYNVDCRLPDRYSPFKTAYTVLGLPIFAAMSLISPQKAWQNLRPLFHPQSWLTLLNPPARHGPPSGVELSRVCEQFCQDVPQTEQEVEQKAWELKYIFDWYSGAMHNSQPFTKRYDFLKDIVRKTITLVPGICSFRDKQTVEFENGSQAEVDTVVLCTGFATFLPFFVHNPNLDGRDLYKNIFLPGDPTLAFIGFTRPNIGAAPPVAEMQARWFAGLLTGRLQLPDAATMKATILADAQKYNKTRPYHVKRLKALVDYHAYMNQLADIIGCQPNLWRLLTKPKLLYFMLFGPYASYQYRLHGYGANVDKALEAAEQIPTIPKVRVLQHANLFFVLKPLFSLLDKLGFHNLKPVF